MTKPLRMSQSKNSMPEMLWRVACEEYEGYCMKVFQYYENEQWNDVVKSFPEWDIYYLNEYACSMKLHGDGVPILIYYEKEGKRLAYVMMQNDIAQFIPLKDCLEKGYYFDWTTPYGYGGPLVDGVLDSDWIQEFEAHIEDYCRKHAIVSQFFRFHPLYQNQKIFEQIADIVYLKKTVYIDTSSETVIFKNMTPNNRNMVRKAIKNGVKVFSDHGECVVDFIRIYKATMKHNAASEYYYFSKDYYDYLIKQMGDNLVFFYSTYEGKIISAAIFFYNDNYMHYHLSGTLPEYRTLASTNLLLSEAANWAAKQGIQRLHLGGGVETEDSLLSFKKHFNRNGLLDFCIGRNIFIPDAYEELIKLRELKDATFQKNESYLIGYRG